MKYLKGEQAVFSLLILGGLLPVLYFYLVHVRLENENKIFRKKIENVHCSHFRSRTSAFQILHHAKNYEVEVPTPFCRQLKNGQSVGLLYNKRLDYFFLPGKSETNLFQIYIISVAFVLSLLPWKKWFSFEK